LKINGSGISGMRIRQQKDYISIATLAITTIKSQIQLVLIFFTIIGAVLGFWGWNTIEKWNNLESRYSNILNEYSQNFTALNDSLYISLKSYQNQISDINQARLDQQVIIDSLQKRILELNSQIITLSDLFQNVGIKYQYLLSAHDKRFLYLLACEIDSSLSRSSTPKKAFELAMMWKNTFEPQIALEIFNSLKSKRQDLTCIIHKKSCFV